MSREYDPPSWKNEDDRRAYDEQWEREKATENYVERTYDPPSWKKEDDRRAYDEQWERERAKRDYHE